MRDISVISYRPNPFFGFSIVLSNIRYAALKYRSTCIVSSFHQFISSYFCVLGQEVKIKRKVSDGKEKSL